MNPEIYNEPGRRWLQIRANRHLSQCRDDQYIDNWKDELPTPVHLYPPNYDHQKPNVEDVIEADYYPAYDAFEFRDPGLRGCFSKRFKDYTFRKVYILFLYYRRKLIYDLSLNVTNFKYLCVCVLLLLSTC